MLHNRMPNIHVSKHARLSYSHATDTCVTNYHQSAFRLSLFVMESLDIEGRDQSSALMSEAIIIRSLAQKEHFERISYTTQVYLRLNRMEVIIFLFGHIYIVKNSLQ